MNSWCGGYCYHCHLSSTILIINLVSLSHTFHIGSYHYFNHPKIFPWKSCVTVLYRGKSTMLVLYQNLYLYSVWVSALFCCAAQRGSALWRATASGLRRRPCSWPLQRLCQHVCKCVNVYTDQTSLPLDYPGQDRLPNWLSGVSQPRV